MTLTHVSLFSGIGGIDLAAEWAGFKTIAFCEKDKYCQQVLRRHWPNVPIIEDVKDVTKEKITTYARCIRPQECQEQTTGVEQYGEIIRHTEGNGGNQVGEIRQGQSPIAGGVYTDGGECGIDLISGGFPCQPHSVAGKRKGSSDSRNLWPEFRRVIGEVKPRWVLAENVPGLFSSDDGRFFGGILSDLAALGYVCGWCTYGAVDVGALHRRDRVFILAHAKQLRLAGESTNGAGGNGRELPCLEAESCGTKGQAQDCTLAHAAECIGLSGSTQPNQWDSEGCCQDVADTKCQGQADNQGGRTHEIMDWSAMLDGSYRESRGYDYWGTEPNMGRVANGIPHRVDRLKGLGNAVVPQQIYPILKAIADTERGK